MQQITKFFYLKILVETVKLIFNNSTENSYCFARISFLSIFQPIKHRYNLHQINSYDNEFQFYFLNYKKKIYK